MWERSRRGVRERYVQYEQTLRLTREVLPAQGLRRSGGICYPHEDRTPPPESIKLGECGFVNHIEAFWLTLRS